MSGRTPLSSNPTRLAESAILDTNRKYAEEATKAIEASRRRSAWPLFALAGAAILIAAGIGITYHQLVNQLVAATIAAPASAGVTSGSSLGLERTFSAELASSSTSCEEAMAGTSLAATMPVSADKSTNVEALSFAASFVPAMEAKEATADKPAVAVKASADKPALPSLKRNGGPLEPPLRRKAHGRSPNKVAELKKLEAVVNYLAATVKGSKGVSLFDPVSTHWYTYAGMMRSVQQIQRYCGLPADGGYGKLTARCVAALVENPAAKPKLEEPVAKQRQPARYGHNVVRANTAAASIVRLRPSLSLGATATKTAPAVPTVPAVRPASSDRKAKLKMAFAPWLHASVADILGIEVGNGTPYALTATFPFYMGSAAVEDNGPASRRLDRLITYGWRLIFSRYQPSSRVRGKQNAPPRSPTSRREGPAPSAVAMLR